MFNLFPNNTAKDIIDSMPKFGWRVGPSFYINEKEYTIGELVEYIKNLIKENNDLNNTLKSIEKDGTEEHNNAIKLREENVELKKILIDLKEENTQLMDRVNEIDSDQNEEYRAEVFRLRNDNAIWKAKHGVLLEKYNGIVAQGGLRYMEARLNAANKENEKLKKEKKESFEILKKTIEDESDRSDKLASENTNNWINLKAANKEIEKLKKDIVDYVFEKDNQVNFFEEELKRLKSITKEEYDKIPVVGSADIIGNLLQKAKDLVEGVEVDLDRPLDEQCDKEDHHEKPKQYNQFQDDMYYQDAYAEKKEKSWEEAASDLALRVVKLEKKLEELTLALNNIQNPYSVFALNPDGTFNNTIPCNVSYINPDGTLNIKGTI